MTAITWFMYYIITLIYLHALCQAHVVFSLTGTGNLEVEAWTDQMSVCIE